jgi:hypothetical protein
MSGRRRRGRKLSFDDELRCPELCMRRLLFCASRREKPARRDSADHQPLNVSVSQRQRDPSLPIRLCPSI